jgi:hypothetical protein
MFHYAFAIMELSNMLYGFKNVTDNKISMEG